MKQILILLCLTVASCSSVKQRSIPTFDTLFFGYVEGRKAIVLEPNESKAARVAYSVIPSTSVVEAIVYGVGASVTEDGFSEPKAFEYIIVSDDGLKRSIVSFSWVEEGSCVEVISPDESAIEILMKVALENCGERNE